MLLEARDERRRQAFRLARRLRHGPAQEREVLAFLSAAARLLAEERAGPRRRPAPGGRYLL
jgi:hypothetical protein